MKTGKPADDDTGAPRVDFDMDFFKSFDICLNGLDNVDARPVNRVASRPTCRSSNRAPKATLARCVRSSGQDRVLRVQAAAAAEGVSLSARSVSSGQADPLHPWAWCAVYEDLWRAGDVCVCVCEEGKKEEGVEEGEECVVVLRRLKENGGNGGRQASAATAAIATAVS